MSGMELLDEEFTSETLHQALAFIDASDPSSSFDELSISSSSRSDWSPGSDPFTQEEATPSAKSRLPTSSVARTRKRHSAKSELERLRHDVQTLEKTLARVKSKSLRSNQVAPAPDSTAVSVAAQLAAERANNEMEALWMDLAVTQHLRRQQSEATNRQLKRSIAKQLKVAKYREALIARRTLAEDRDASYDPRLSDYHHFQNHSRDDELVFAHLLIRSQQLYATMDIHIEEAGILLANSLATQTKRRQDPTQRAMFETVSCSGVPLSVQHTDDRIWNGFFKDTAKNRPGVNDYVLTEDGLRKNYLTTYQHLSNTFDLHSRTVMRKYNERSRIVYTWTTVTVLGSKGLRFLTQAMVVMEPSPTLPQNAAVMKKWLRFGGEQIDPSKLSVQEADPLIEGILKSLGNKTTTTWSWLENNLLSSTNAVPPCAPR